MVRNHPAILLLYQKRPINRYVFKEAEPVETVEDDVSDEEEVGVRGGIMLAEETKDERESMSWEVDPISRERLSSADETGIRLRGQIYHVPTLIDYLVKTDDMRDPVSREPFTQMELEALDKKAEILGLRERSGSFSSRTPEEEMVATSQRRRAKSLSEEVQSLEAVLGEFVSELAALIDADQPPINAMLYPLSIFAINQNDASHHVDYESTEMSVMLILSQFEGPYVQLKALAFEQAFFTLSSYKQFLRGPPKKPKVDGRLRCLSTITTLLDNMWTKEENDVLNRLRGVA